MANPTNTIEQPINSTGVKSRESFSIFTAV